jgi:hypothetical protein
MEPVTKVRSLLFLVIPTLAFACHGSEDDAASQDLALVNDVQCSVARGAFVPKSTASASGELKVTCPGVRGVMFNGETVNGQALTAFTVKPREGINILHVERGDGDDAKTTDIPFLFGTFNDAKAFVPNAVVVRAAAAGLSTNGALALPLAAGPTTLTLSQIGSQVLRDQGNLLARYDGTGKDVSGFGFHAGVKIVRSGYDAKNVSVVVTPRDKGVHIEASVAAVTSTIAWDAGITVFEFHDEVTATIGQVNVSADLDYAYDASTKKLRGSLGAHTVKVQNVDLDSAALSRIPLGIGEGLEDAISIGAEALINQFADPVLERVKDKLVPAFSIAIEQLRLPPRVDIPGIGGTVEIAQSFDGAKFESDAIQVSLGARVTAAKPNAIEAPGFLSRPTQPATFTAEPAFGASVSIDYVNQALFAAWKQGILNRQISGPVSQLGISTEAIFSDAKMPPVVFPHPDGKGLMLNLGEFHITTVFHSTSAGDAKVKFAVTLLAGANIQLSPGGENLIIKPNKDDARTKFVAELVGVEQGKQDAAAELAGLLSLFAPVIEAMIANDFDFPPVAIPAIDLALLSPGFAGRKGRFDGAIRFEPTASRIAVEGKLVAR